MKLAPTTTRALGRRRAARRSPGCRRTCGDSAPGTPRRRRSVRCTGSAPVASSSASNAKRRAVLELRRAFAATSIDATRALSTRSMCWSRVELGGRKRNPVFLRRAGQIVLREIRADRRRRVVRADHRERAVVALAPKHVGGGQSGGAAADDDDGRRRSTARRRAGFGAGRAAASRGRRSHRRRARPPAVRSDPARARATARRSAD